MHGLIRERHTNINNKCRFIIFHNSHVSTNFTKSTQWSKSYFAVVSNINLFPWIHSKFIHFIVFCNRSFHLFTHWSWNKLFRSSSTTITVWFLVPIFVMCRFISSWFVACRLVSSRFSIFVLIIVLRLLVLRFFCISVYIVIWNNNITINFYWLFNNVSV